MIDKIPHHLKIGADVNNYLIALLKYKQLGGVFPKHITKEEWQEVRNNKKNYPDWYVGYCGFVCSFRGNFFPGYCGVSKSRDFQRELRNNFLNQNLDNIQFIYSDYISLKTPPNSVIYCDPPYKDTLGYNITFDHDIFWEWCRFKASQGHKVYISEYSAPKDFKCVWSKPLNVQIGGKKHGSIEKLFTI